MTGRAYGPHRPEDVPRVVLVGHDLDPACPEHYEPVDVGLALQREYVNTLAYEAGRS